MSQKPTAYKVREDALAAREEEARAERTPTREAPKPAATPQAAAVSGLKAAAPPQAPPAGGTATMGTPVAPAGGSGAATDSDGGVLGMLASMGGGGQPPMPFEPTLGPGLRAGLGQRAYPQRNTALAALQRIY